MMTGAEIVRGLFAEWEELQWSALIFEQRDAAILIACVGAVLVLLTLIIRYQLGGGLLRERVALPAVLATFRRTRFCSVRHLPIALVTASLPCFLLALADPLTTMTRETRSYPGRRIALFVDASGSMMEPFATKKLRQVDEPAFFTTVAAAEYFMRLRIEGRYRDLMALIEFGDEAYVVTPFTTDYENILLSLSLINSWNEWQRFNSRGTVIINALSVAIDLFRTFDFLEASGNAMVIFSDGEDTQVTQEGRPLVAILEDAVRFKIPVYMLRIAADKQLGDAVPDNVWKQAIEKTGGRFYPIADEAAIFKAVHEIDRLAAGRIDITHYTVKQPQFGAFAFAALVLWTFALILRLTIPHFSRFP